MAIHLYKTSTLSTRNGTVDSQVKSNPQNNLIYGQRRCGKGHNARGIITARLIGGGHKRLHHKIDFRWNEKDIYGRIVTIECDPNQNAYICLIQYGDGEKIRKFFYPYRPKLGFLTISKIPLFIYHFLSSGLFFSLIYLVTSCKSSDEVSSNS